MGASISTSNVDLTPCKGITDSIAYGQCVVQQTRIAAAKTGNTDVLNALSNPGAPMIYKLAAPSTNIQKSTETLKSVTPASGTTGGAVLSNQKDNAANSPAVQAAPATSSGTVFTIIVLGVIAFLIVKGF